MTFQHKKSLGQHFLNNNYIPKKMCDAADITAGETVLEIGPGTGILTREILNRQAKVIALEADERAILLLTNTFKPEIENGVLTIYHYDVRNLNTKDFNLINQDYKVVANIPYYLSGYLFRNLLDTTIQPNTLVFLIQKEVANRIARDQKESLLSLSIKIFGTPTYIETVKRGHFTPPPKIDSAILKVSHINRCHFSDYTSEYFFHILHLAFGQKRKQLLKNLSTEFPRGDLILIFNQLNIKTDIRAEDLPLSIWLELIKELDLKT